MQDKENTERLNETRLGAIPLSVSGRLFLGTMWGASAVCAGNGAAFTSDTVISTMFPADSMVESNSLNLLPRLTHLPEGVVGIARPWLDLNVTWQFNPKPAAEFWKDASETVWSDILVPGEWTMQGFSTGIILTKLDGTAKGGVVIAIAHELGLPIQFVGVGEKIDDLLSFNPQEFVQSLFEA